MAETAVKFNEDIVWAYARQDMFENDEKWTFKRIQTYGSSFNRILIGYHALHKGESVTGARYVTLNEYLAVKTMEIIDIKRLFDEWHHMDYGNVQEVYERLRLALEYLGKELNDDVMLWLRLQNYGIKF